MTRTRPVHPHQPRRRLVRTLAAGSIAAAGLAAVALPSNASADGLSTTISRWSSADFALGDASNTKLTVAGGVDEVGIIGRRLTPTQTVSIKLDQSRCRVVGGSDVLVTRTLATEVPVNTGVRVNPLLGSASVKATLPVSGTETSTPAGTGGDCNELDAVGATSTPIGDTVKVDVSWSNARGSSPLAYGDIYQQGVFYYRDATAKGTVSSASTGAKTLRASTSGWLWSGAWVYATGT